MSFWGSLWPGVPATANVIKSNDVYASDTTPLSVIGGGTTVTPVVNGNNWPPLPGTANVIKSQNVFLNNTTTLGVIGGSSVTPSLNSLASQGVYATATTPLSVIGGGGSPVGPSAAPTIPVLFAASDVSIAVAFNTDGITGTPKPTYSGLYGTTTNPTSTIDAIFAGQTFYRLHVSSLTLGTTLYFKSVASNPSGVSTSAVSLGFSTNAIGPNIPPSIPAFISSSTDTMIVSFDAAGISGQPPPTYSTLYGTTTSPTTPADAVFSSGTIYQTILTGLSTGTNYYFKSLAGNPGGVSTSAVSAAYSTIGPPPTPVGPNIAPSIPAFNSANSTSMIVSFDVAGVTGVPAPTYSTLWGTTTSPTTPIDAVLSSGTIYQTTLTGLSSATNYYFESLAGNASGVSTSAVSAAYSTIAGPVPPVGPNIAPTIPAFVPGSASVSSLSVTFDVAGITGEPPPTYSTLWSPDNVNYTPTDAVLSSGTIYQTTLTGLSTFANYHFKSEASNPTGVSTSAASVAYSTLGIPPSGPPTTPALIEATSTTLLVSFDVAGITGTPTPTYIAEYGTTPTTLTSATAALSTGTIWTANIPTSIPVLTPATAYFVSARAFNTSGSESSPSTIMSTLGGSLIPSNIPNPTLLTATTSTITLALDTAGVIGEQPIVYQGLGGDAPLPCTTGVGDYVLSTGTIYTLLVSSIGGSPLNSTNSYYFRTDATNSAGSSVSPNAGVGPFNVFAPPTSAPTIPVFQNATTTSISWTFDVAGIGGTPLPSTFGIYINNGLIPGTLSTGTIYNATATGLSPYIDYLCQSYASNIIGILSSSVSAQSQVLSPPTALGVTNVGTGFSSISVLSPKPTQIGNPVASTFITYALSTSGGFTAFSTPSVYVSSSDAYFGVITGLTSSTTYNVGTLISNPISTISVFIAPVTTAAS